MKHSPEQDPVARDAHLLAALRHAPDADVGAPAHVSAQIVAAAYRAADERPAARAAAVAPRSLWRLGASGAFASVVLAGVIGLLWREETPPAMSERVAAAAPEPIPAAATSAPAPVATATPTATAAAALPAADAAPAAPALDAERRRSTVRAAASRLPPAPPAPAQGATVADAVSAQARPGPTVGTGAPEALALAPTPSPAAVVLAEVTPPPPAPLPATAAAPTPATRITPVPAAATMARASATATDSARAEQAQRQSLVAAQRSAASPPALMALVGPRHDDPPWLPAIAAGSTVQWRVDGQWREAPAPWLQALALRTQGRWRPSSEVAAAGEREVQWQRGGTVLGRLWLNATRVLWCNEDGRCEAAVLAPGAGADLLESLPR